MAFHVEKLRRDNHENITNFSLGMLSYWGIHYFEIAQWGNGTDETGPVSVEGEAKYPEQGGCDAVLSWNMRSDTLPQLAAMSLKAKRKLLWDPKTESFTNDDRANALMSHRPFRDGWKLPKIG